MMEKVYIPEPWPEGMCAVCEQIKPIVATVRRTDEDRDRLCCEDCWRQIPERLR